MELVLVGTMFVVLGFSMSIGQTMLSSNAQTICTNGGDSWASFQRSNGTAGNGTDVFPLDSSWTGCCDIVNGTNASLCNWWQTGSYALNTTYYAQRANSTLAYWMPILALAVIAGIIISVILAYMLGAVGGGRKGV